MIEDMVAKGQQVYRKLKYAPFPVVAAPSAWRSAAAARSCLNADAVQAHAETYIGLVETGVGIVPAWGGCKDDAADALGAEPEAPRRADAAAHPGVRDHRHGQGREVRGRGEASSVPAPRRRHHHEPRPPARRRQGEGARAGRRLPAPAPRAIALPGPSAQAALQIWRSTPSPRARRPPHDQVVAGQLAEVLSGGETDVTETVTEDDLLALERPAFMTLIRHPATLARIEHMLETGKPLRN